MPLTPNFHIVTLQDLPDVEANIVQLSDEEPDLQVFPEIFDQI